MNFGPQTASSVWVTSGRLAVTGTNTRLETRNFAAVAVGGQDLKQFAD